MRYFQGAIDAIVKSEDELVAQCIRYAELAAQYDALNAKASDWKGELDRVADAIYPHKAGDRYTYSVDFMIEEIKRRDRKIASLLAHVPPSGAVETNLHKPSGDVSVG